MAEARRAWIAAQGSLNPKRLVFIDETSTNTKMTRAYGRCPTHQRLIGRQPFGHWMTTTFIAGLRCDGITAPFVLKGAMDRPAFLTYLDQVLGPTLSPGDIVIMDNLATHKGDAVKALIESYGASVMYLPAYSPDLNPIELAFSKLKTLLRKAGERTVGGLWDRIGQVLDAFTAQECASYLKHDGYAAT